MPGPLDILRTLQGSNQQRQAPPVRLPAFDAGSAEELEKMKKQIKGINDLIRTGKAGWKDYAKREPIIKATAATQNLAKAQKELNRLIKDANASIADRAKAYRRVSEAQKKARKEVESANRELNEQKGMLGRFKNTLDDVAKHKGMSIFTAALHDANIVLGDMNKQFNVLARQGAAGEMTFGELAGATAKFSGEMRIAMLNAATLGVEAKESNAAFLRLTETFGGSEEVVANLGDRWRGMATLARMSGLGMADVAALADQGFRRLGESVDTTMDNVVAMTKVTQELNQRFGEGSVNTREFAKSVNTLAYSKGFYNQNTRLVIEALSREVQMQLALGRSREAAVQKAQKNLEMAGKVNIVGITEFRSEIQRAYKNAEDQQQFLAGLQERFGDQGRTIASMLERGSLMTGGGLFAFQEAVKQSTELRAAMMEDIRVQALAGPNALLAKGIKFGEAMLLVEESRAIADNLAKVAAGDRGVTRTLFGDTAERGEETKQLISELRKERDKPLSQTQMLSMFYKMGGAGQKMAEAAVEDQVGKPPGEAWKEYVDTVEGKGGTWFAGITNSLSAIKSLLGEVPIALAGVMGGLMLRGPLGRMLGNIATRGTGAAGMIGSPSRGMGGLAKAGAKAGLIGAGIAAIGGFAYGIVNASDILGKQDPSKWERVAAGLGSAISTITMGIVDAAAVAKGETALQKWAYDVAWKPFEDDTDVNAPRSKEEDIKAQYEFHKKRRAAKGEEPLSFEEYKRMRSTVKPAEAVAAASRAKVQAAASRPQTRPSDQAPVGATEAGITTGAKGPATAAASMSGGSLILEVNNWEDVFAQTQHNLIGSES